MDHVNRYTLPFKFTETFTYNITYNSPYNLTDNLTHNFTPLPDYFIYT